MKSTFIKTLWPFLLLSKLFGIGRYSYRMNAEFLMFHSDSFWCAAGNILQISWCAFLTYNNLKLPTSLWRYFDLVRFWSIVTTVWLSESWKIKLINGIIKFDLNYSSLPPVSLLQSPNKKFWTLVFVAYLLFYSWLRYMITFKVIHQYDFIHIVSSVMFDVPRVIDFILFASAFFFLSHLGWRFCALNSFWEKLLAGLLLKPSKWTIEEVAMLVECSRLLHADLSDILRLFSLAYGPVMLLLFTYVIFDVWFAVLISLYLHASIPAVIALAIQSQNIIFIVSVLSVASWTSQKKEKIIVSLRSCQIAHIPEELRTQIKLFMKQVSSYNTYEMSACGIFNFKLHFLISITVAIIKFVATMIQMDQHPYLRFLVHATVDTGPWNDTKS